MTWTVTPGKRLPKYLWLKRDKPTLASDETDISKYCKSIDPNWSPPPPPIFPLPPDKETRGG